VVERWRAKNKWTQRMLAERAGLHEHTIERVENGAEVDEDSLRKIARAFDWPEDALFRKIIYVATIEEQEQDYTKQLAEGDEREARAVETLEDCDRILTVRGYTFDPNVPVHLLGFVEAFIDIVQRWTRNYLELMPEQRYEASTALLWSARRMEIEGYCAKYIAWTADDQITMAQVFFVSVSRKQPEMVRVPRRMREMLLRSRPRE
jgi:transcriptional regulator with XRE-family HTH domain